MNTMKFEKGSFSPMLVVVSLFIIVPLLLIAWGEIGSQVKYSKLRDEIARVESETGVKARSVECDDGSLAAMCSVEYDSLSYEQTKAMLSRGGYAFDASSSQASMSAKNITRNTSVTIDRIGENSQPTTVRYKDIDVTL